MKPGRRATVDLLTNDVIDPIGNILGLVFCTARLETVAVAAVAE